MVGLFSLSEFAKTQLLGQHQSMQPLDYVVIEIHGRETLRLHAFSIIVNLTSYI